MSDELDQFFRCVEGPQGWGFEVAIVEWPHPHEPELEWTTFRRWKTTPDSARLENARTAAFSNSRYFRTCTRCHEMTNAGHMHDKQICQSCAERHLGVVY